MDVSCVRLHPPRSVPAPFWSCCMWALVPCLLGHTLGTLQHVVMRRRSSSHGKYHITSCGMGRPRTAASPQASAGTSPAGAPALKTRWRPARQVSAIGWASTLGCVGTAVSSRRLGVMPHTSSLGVEPVQAYHERCVGRQCQSLEHRG